MSLRFQRRISLGKFFRLNLSKSGLGLSAGVPGLRVGTGPRGPYGSAGLPGTGLSVRSRFGSNPGSLFVAVVALTFGLGMAMAFVWAWLQ